jgi:hypothetical protein
MSWNVIKQTFQELSLQEELIAVLASVLGSCIVVHHAWYRLRSLNRGRGKSQLLMDFQLERSRWKQYLQSCTCSQISESRTEVLCETV